MRVLGLVAQRGMIAEDFRCQRINGGLTLRVTLAGMPSCEVDLIARKIGGLIAVEEVRITESSLGE